MAKNVGLKFPKITKRRMLLAGAALAVIPGCSPEQPPNQNLEQFTAVDPKVCQTFQDANPSLFSDEKAQELVDQAGQALAQGYQLSKSGTTEPGPYATTKVPVQEKLCQVSDVLTARVVENTAKLKQADDPDKVAQLEDTLTTERGILAGSHIALRKAAGPYPDRTVAQAERAHQADLDAVSTAAADAPTKGPGPWDAALRNQVLGWDELKGVEIAESSDRAHAQTQIDDYWFQTTAEQRDPERDARDGEASGRGKLYQLGQNQVDKLEQSEDKLESLVGTAESELRKNVGDYLLANDLVFQGDSAEHSRLQPVASETTLLQRYLVSTAAAIEGKLDARQELDAVRRSQPPQTISSYEWYYGYNYATEQYEYMCCQYVTRHNPEWDTWRNRVSALEREVAALQSTSDSGVRAINAQIPVAQKVLDDKGFQASADNAGAQEAQEWFEGNGKRFETVSDFASGAGQQIGGEIRVYEDRFAPLAQDAQNQFKVFDDKLREAITTQINNYRSPAQT